MIRHGLRDTVCCGLTERSEDIDAKRFVYKPCISTYKHTKQNCLATGIMGAQGLREFFCFFFQ